MSRGRGSGRGTRALSGAVVVAAVVALTGCQTGRGGDPGAGPGAPGDPGSHPCAQGAPEIESLTIESFEGEPPPERMDWEIAASELAQEVTAVAGDRLAAVWIAWAPDRTVEVRLTQGPALPELDALAAASELDLNVAYDRAFSEAELLAVANGRSADWAGLPGLSGMSVDTLSSRLLFYVASGDDGGASTCTAIAEILAEAGVPYAFEVFEGPTEGTVRQPVTFTEVYLVDDRTLQMNVASCNGDPELTALEETEGEVRLEVTSTVAAPGWASQDCLDGIEVTLDAPLGDRTLVDITTGNVVDVARPPG